MFVFPLLHLYLNLSVLCGVTFPVPVPKHPARRCHPGCVCPKPATASATPFVPCRARYPVKGRILPWTQRARCRVPGERSAAAPSPSHIACPWGRGGFPSLVSPRGNVPLVLQPLAQSRDCPSRDPFHPLSLRWLQTPTNYTNRRNDFFFLVLILDWPPAR